VTNDDRLQVYGFYEYYQGFQRSKMNLVEAFVRAIVMTSDDRVRQIRGERTKPMLIGLWKKRYCVKRGTHHGHIYGARVQSWQRDFS